MGFLDRLLRWNNPKRELNIELAKELEHRMPGIIEHSKDLDDEGVARVNVLMRLEKELGDKK